MWPVTRSLIVVAKRQKFRRIRHKDLVEGEIARDRGAHAGIPLSGNGKAVRVTWHSQINGVGNVGFFGRERA